MKNWIVPSNNTKFKLSDCLTQYGFVDWKQSVNFECGDIVFIYCSKFERRIRYKMVVEKVNMTFDESMKCEQFWCDGKEFEKAANHNRFCRLSLLAEVDTDLLSFDLLEEKGLQRAPQGSRTIPSELLLYLNSVFNADREGFSYTDEIGMYSDVPIMNEGALKTVYVSRYERNPIARRRCIEAMGCSCSVCGFNFEEIYGSVGKGFIEVHHLIPLSEIKENYIVDPKRDLIPVCSNCHSMLHRLSISGIDCIEMLKKIRKECKHSY